MDGCKRKSGLQVWSYLNFFCTRTTGMLSLSSPITSLLPQNLRQYPRSMLQHSPNMAVISLQALHPPKLSIITPLHEFPFLLRKLLIEFPIPPCHCFFKTLVQHFDGVFDTVRAVNDQDAEVLFVDLLRGRDKADFRFADKYGHCGGIGDFGMMADVEMVVEKQRSELANIYIF